MPSLLRQTKAGLQRILHGRNIRNRAPVPNRTPAVLIWTIWSLSCPLLLTDWFLLSASTRFTKPGYRPSAALVTEGKPTWTIPSSLRSWLPFRAPCRSPASPRASERQVVSYA